MGKGARRIISRAVPLLILGGIAIYIGINTGSEDSTEIDLGEYGGTITVPVDISDKPAKEGQIALLTAIADSAGYSPAYERCLIDALEDIPESRFETLVEEEKRGGVSPITEECGARGELIRPDATTDQVATYKTVTGSSLGTEMRLRTGLTKPQASCVVALYQDQPDAQFIQTENGTARQARQKIRQWVRDCA